MDPKTLIGALLGPIGPIAQVPIWLNPGGASIKALMGLDLGLEASTAVSPSS